MKNYRNYYSNQAKRRADPNIRQIKGGKVTKNYTAESFLAAPAPAEEQGFQLPESVTVVDSAQSV